MATILIVEDEELVRERLEQLIINMGKEIKVMLAATKKEAQQITKCMDMDIFIIDIGLPDGDGIELARELKINYPLNPIIIESGNGDNANYNRLHDQIEYSAFLVKPFLDSQLIDKVNIALSYVEGLNKSSSITIGRNGYVRIIQMRHIIYIEKIKDQRKVAIASINADNDFSIEEYNGYSLNSVVNMLKNKNELLRCHKSFIVNPKMITELIYSKDAIKLMHTDREIPIGRAYREAIDCIIRRGGTK